uniref:DNA-directed RNA polymerase n=1 Tax=Rhizophora mucronata TaxID=61149 RepID=A0A2P2NFR7_RHIMU
MTRQRLDMFTSEEQAILSDVEHMMQLIRRIMHQSGYNDGDPLSADDQLYVLDNVFTHHPDKAVKMGSGIGHVTVSRHSSFQGSRCFYIVSTNGSKQDFSYRKCLENYIKGKYPQLAEDFIAKYFSRNRPGGHRQRTLASEGGRNE